MNLLLPEEYHKMDAFSKENITTYGFQSESSSCTFSLTKIDENYAMPFDDKKSVIEGIHSVLKDNQGLVEVESGVTKNNKKYIYSIVKTGKAPSGIKYSLSFDIENVASIQGSFEEIGRTGKRDSTILNKLMTEGKISMDMQGWTQDPYDKDYNKGLLLNLSEDSKYDFLFPDHPLSKLRSLIKYIVDNN